MIVCPTMMNEILIPGLGAQVFADVEMLQFWALNVLLAAAILGLGWWAAALARRLIRRFCDAKDLDKALAGFFSSIVYYLLIAVAVVAALSKLGVPTTSVVALLGAAGLAVGLALQNSLSNFAAGVMLLLFRPFRIGDFIEAGGTSGIVEGIDLLTTNLKTPDGKKVIVPNGAILAGVITNVTAYNTRRVDWSFAIGYNDDLDSARAVIAGVLDADDRILRDPAPTIDLERLGDSSVDFVVRAWVAKEDWWAVNCAIREQVKKAFDAKGITIPFPQRGIHVFQQASGQ